MKKEQEFITDSPTVSSLSVEWQRALYQCSKIATARGYNEMIHFPEKPHLWFLSFGKMNPLDSITSILKKCHKMIYCVFEKKLNIEGVKDILQTCEVLGINKLWIVVCTTMTASAKKAFSHITNMELEIWKMMELQYDIRDHDWYCHHEKISIDEKQTLQRQLGKDDAFSQFPKILKSDMIVRFYGYDRGDVLRIYRRDQSIVYRIVK